MRQAAAAASPSPQLPLPDFHSVRPIPYSPSPLGPRISLRVMATSSSTAAARHALFSFAVMILLAMSLSASGPSLTRAAAPWDPIIRLPSNRLAPDPGEGGRLDDEEETGTKWALLVAGSSGYGNYRHQADVCHAYQLLRRGGLREENIVVMMHDDIAHNPLNPRQGVIINHPQGQDVYAGVPKVHAHQWDSSVFVILNLSLDSRELVDFLVRPSLLCRGRNGQRTLGLSRCLQDYTKEQVTTKNLYAVLLGDRSAIEGGSGKVIDSKPDDRIFIYYSDHGGPGVKMRTSNHDTYNTGSHVMEYGDKSVKSDMLSLYQGFDPAIANVTENALRQRMPMGVINQRDADLLFMWKMLQRTTAKRKPGVGDVIQATVTAAKTAAARWRRQRQRHQIRQRRDANPSDGDGGKDSSSEMAKAAAPNTATARC
ncbi:hypothetical protein B296_00023313 [Ensete ventricosum]|uniref:Uncharacterized protein n=1 Tax=Ensete ventricosum TaxID=4639 RepID=A0A427A6B2_ENSVE|nr:hypothetical protein B296_00023313 [Ensete ventricosum]